MTGRPGFGEPLTARELQIVALIGRGLTNPAIGRELCLSELTMKSHLVRIGDKLGAANRAGIVGAAYRTRQVPVTRTGDVELPEDLVPVLIGVARGWSNAEIAADMVLSTHAVKARIVTLFRLLGVHDRAAAVRAGLECGALTLVPRARQGAGSVRC